MRILLTGAAGFLGAALLRLWASAPDRHEMTAIDLASNGQLRDVDRLRWIEGSLDDRRIMDQAFVDPFDVVFHLASVPGGLAEREPALGRRINLDATLNLFERLAATGGRPRVVYASSVAVYGNMDGRPIGSDSPTRPTSTYGAHKLMAEIALADHVRRGQLSGVALRLPGLIARPGAAAGFGSAFMSELPRAFAAGQPYVCPVSSEATAWWMSAGCAARNLVRAAAVEVCGAVQLPALRLSVAAIVDTLANLFGQDRRALVSFKPDPRIEELFGRYPELMTKREEILGFAHDGTPEKLIAEALET